MTNEYRKYLQSEDWVRKRLELFELRGRKCEICWDTENLHVHHKTYANIFNEYLDDLQIVCRDCHSRIHSAKGFKLNNKFYGKRRLRIREFTRIRKSLGVPYSKKMECKFDYSEYIVLLRKLFKAHGLKLSKNISPERARQEILLYLELSPYDRAIKYSRLRDV